MQATQQDDYAVEGMKIKHILCLILCLMFSVVCLQTSCAEESEVFHATYQCDSETVIAARVSNEFEYVSVRVHAQYPFRILQNSEEKVIVKGIEINGKRYELEPVYIDELETGSRIDYDYRITNFFDNKINSVRIYISENIVNGENNYALDLINENERTINSSAIVKGTSSGNVYGSCDLYTQIGRLLSGTKVTIYFITDSGWAAIGTGSREAEAWGYMKTDELCIGEDELYNATSQIQQLYFADECCVYNNVDCSLVSYELQPYSRIDILGYFGKACFIKSGYQYGYIPADIVSSCSIDLSHCHPFVYQADVRRALLNVVLTHNTADDYIVSANIEYTPKYTVNDDIESIAVYVNGNDRFVLSTSNNYSANIILEDQLTSLVLVPIWASGGELIEDAVIVPLLN